MSNDQADAERVLEDVAATFLPRPARRPRSRPHRCLGCGKVSATIFCRDTYDACRALYQERQR